MKITLQRNTLSKALQYTSRAVSAKPNIPILSNVLLEVNKNALKLSATNLEMGMLMWIPGTVTSEGATTVSAKYIAEFVSAATDSNVDIELDGNNVRVQTQKSKAQFNTISSEEFPVLPKLSKEPIFVINKEIFSQALEKVVFACSTDLSAGRIQQSGVFFNIRAEENKIDLVGLDGFRLSKKTIEAEQIATDISKEEIIVPARYLNEAAKIMADFDDVETIEVYLSENGSQFILSFGEVEYSIRLLEGPYPDYEKIMPDSSSYSFELSKAALEESLKIVNSFARGSLGNKILFDYDLENSKVTLQSSVSEIGEGQTEILVEKAEGESDLNSAYTIRFLQDFVNHVSGETIIYETKSQLAPAVLSDKDDKDFIHLIMPLRREV